MILRSLQGLPAVPPPHTHTLPLGRLRVKKKKEREGNEAEGGKILADALAMLPVFLCSPPNTFFFIKVHVLQIQARVSQAIRRMRGCLSCFTSPQSCKGFREGAPCRRKEEWSFAGVGSAKMMGGRERKKIAS